MCVIIHVSLLLYIFLNVLKKSVILRQDAPSIYIYFTTELCILKKEKQQQKGTFCDQVCCKEFCFMSLRILHLFQLCRPKWCIRKALDCCRMQSHPPTTVTFSSAQTTSRLFTGDCSQHLVHCQHVFLLLCGMSSLRLLLRVQVTVLHVPTISIPTLKSLFACPVSPACVRPVWEDL